MANQFSVDVPNVLQALMAGEQGYKDIAAIRQQKQMQSVREQAAQDVMQGGDSRPAIARLLGIGDIQGAHTLAGLDQNNRDFAFRQQQADRSQSNADRSFKLQEKQTEEKPQYQTIEDNNGNKQLVQIDPFGRGAKVIVPSGMNTEAPNPYAPNHKLTGDEAKDRLFVNRMVSSHNIINGLENINEGTAGYVGGVLASRPSIRDSAAFNTMASPERQKSVQAQRDFVNAILRKESGAAISEGEFNNAQRQYFPQPGDNPEVIAQKHTNRMMAIEGMMQGTGKGYKPPPEYVGTKGPASTPPPQAASVAAAQPTPGRPPKVGEIRDGYRYRGGNPGDPASWVPMK